MKELTLCQTKNNLFCQHQNKEQRIRIHQKKIGNIFGSQM